MADKYEILKKYFGYTTFRSGQDELIESILWGRDVLGVMPTGAGKSLCFQVPALMMEGITIVISPLISLMKDQVTTLVQQGVSAAYINASLTFEQYKKVLFNTRQGKYKIIYVAPERLMVDSFLEICNSLTISMVAVDEAHCVSQWGQDFRPSYLNIKRFIDHLKRRPIICAFTATATKEVKEDIIRILELRNPEIVTTGFDRPNLHFSVMKPQDKDNMLLKLINERKDRTGIVYCISRKSVEEVCNFLNAKGINATRYHAGLEDEERVKNQDDFVYDRKTVMVATNAFGMGIDKSNVSYVIHYNMPKNIENYYQEAGRAGRDGTDAECILLYAPKDVRTHRFMMENSEPNPELTEAELEFVRQRDEERLKQMTFYCTTEHCLRKQMLRYFGDRYKENCDNCSNCLGDFKISDVTIDAQKILSCIIRTKQKYGVSIITDILRGRETDKIMSAELNSLSTYGIMKDSKPNEIKTIIEKLESMGCVRFEGKEFPVIKVTEGCKLVLSGDKKVTVKTVKKAEPAKSKGNVGKSQNGVTTYRFNPQLLDELKALRASLARNRGLPAYVIFTDASLLDMCKLLPTTDWEFLQVSGVGERKLHTYGEVFMDVIRKYV